MDIENLDSEELFKALGYYVTKSDFEMVNALMQHPNIEPELHNNIIIIEAVKAGNKEIVKLLLTDKRVDPTKALKYADKEMLDILQNGDHKASKNIRELALVFKDTLNIKEIREIFKQMSTTTLTDSDIDNRIKNVLTSSKQIKLDTQTTMSMISKLDETFNFDESEWNEKEKLGAGSYGQVCKIVKNSETFAKKLFQTSNIDRDIIREIGCYAILSSSKTKYQSNIKGFIYKNNNISIVLDLANGSLYNYARTIPQNGRIQNFHLVFDMAVKCLEEFHACGLIHADIKAANMLAWWNDKTLCKLVLSDFGLSSTTPDFGPDRVYTPGFRAPELSLGIRANKKTDIYAMGQTLLEYLVKQTYDELTQPVLDVINATKRSKQLYAMLDKNPKTRYKLHEMVITFPNRVYKREFSQKLFDDIKHVASLDDFTMSLDLVLRSGVLADLEYFVQIVRMWKGELSTGTGSNEIFIEIIKSVNGIIYLPGLEYMKYYTLDQIESEFRWICYYDSEIFFSLDITKNNNKKPPFKKIIDNR